MRGEEKLSWSCVSMSILSDIEDQKNSTSTKEGGDIRLEAARDSDVSASGVYCQVDFSDDEGVDDEVADHAWVSSIGEKEISEGEY